MDRSSGSGDGAKISIKQDAETRSGKKGSYDRSLTVLSAGCHVDTVTRSRIVQLIKEARRGGGPINEMLISTFSSLVDSGPDLPMPIKVMIY